MTSRHGSHAEPFSNSHSQLAQLYHGYTGSAAEPSAHVISPHTIELSRATTRVVGSANSGERGNDGGEMRRTGNKIRIANEDGLVAKELVEGERDDIDFVPSSPVRWIHFNPENDVFQSYLYVE